MVRKLLTALAFLATAFSVTAAPAAAFERGPAIGAAAPDVTGADQAGISRTRASLSGENGLVLVFARSADWCPYCQRQLIGLEGVRAAIEQRGWRVAAVTTDDVSKLARFAQRRSIGFPLISDEDSSVIRAFDLIDPAFPPGHRAHGVPTPSIFFIRADGTVAAKLGDDDYRVRPAPEVVVATLDQVSR